MKDLQLCHEGSPHDEEDTDQPIRPIRLAWVRLAGRRLLCQPPHSPGRPATGTPPSCRGLWVGPGRRPLRCGAPWSAHASREDGAIENPMATRDCCLYSCWFS